MLFFSIKTGLSVLPLFHFDPFLYLHRFFLNVLGHGPPSLRRPRLDLPDYPSEEVLREKLLQAMFRRH